MPPPPGGHAAAASHCEIRCLHARNRNAPTVTVTAAVEGARSPQAQAVLDALDAELAANSEQIGQTLEWSAAERAVLDLIGDTIDRRADLQARYAACDDSSARLKLAAELRLMETPLARLLKQIKTDLPAAPTRRSQKASQAAYARWSRAADQ